MDEVLGIALLDQAAPSIETEPETPKTAEALPAPEDVEQEPAARAAKRGRRSDDE